MKKLILTILSVAMIVSLSFADDTDLFDQLDDLGLDTKIEEPKEKNIWDKILDGTSGKYTGRYYHFFYSIDDADGKKDTRKDFFSTMLELKTTYATNKIIYNFEGWVETGTERETYQGVTQNPRDDERYRRYFELSELNIVYSEKENQLTAGKKKFKLGKSTLYSPVDKLTLRDMNDPLDPKEIGIWHARIDHFKGQHTFTGAVIPFYSENKTPNAKTRWAGTDSDENSDFDFAKYKDSSITKEPVAKTPEHFSYLGMYKTTISGWDVFGSVFRGVSPYVVLSKETDSGGSYYVKEHPLASVAATGFSTTKGKFEIHGEAYLQVTDDGKDDDFVNAVVGTTYTLDNYVSAVGLEKITFTAEYANEQILDEQDADLYIESSVKQRSGRNDVLGRAEAKVNEDLSIIYFFSRSLIDGGHMQHLGADYKIRDGLTFKSYIDYFDGGKDSYYGKWRKNDRWYNTIEFSF